MHLLVLILIVFIMKFAYQTIFMVFCVNIINGAFNALYSPLCP